MNGRRFSAASSTMGSRHFAFLSVEPYFGQVCYLNEDTQDTTWKHPSSEAARHPSPENMIEHTEIAQDHDDNAEDA